MQLHGTTQPLAADFSAPLLYYKPGPELWNGLMGALRASRFMSRMGLFFAQPYDPNRIPVIFVHGLISTPAMWLRIVNELKSTPRSAPVTNVGYSGIRPAIPSPIRRSNSARTWPN